MHRQTGVLVMVLVLVTTGVASVGAVAGATGGTSAQQGAAQVTFQNQTSAGDTVVIEKVTMPQGGFVAIHDASLTEGHTLASVVGSSTYLSAGTHENVVVQLDEPVSEDTTLIAMPHRDTDGDRIYEFVPTQGKTDGPYTKSGEIVLQGASVTVSATVSMSDQPSDGEFLNVDSVSLSQDGFIAIHDATLLEGKTFESVRGAKYLPAGQHENVRIRLDEPIKQNGTFIPMPHKDTNDNKAYDFVSSDGSQDGPFLNHEGNIVLTTSNVTLNRTASTNIEPQASGGNRVVVDSIYMPNGGFAAIHDSSLKQGKTFASVVGVSGYLKPGLHRNVEVVLNESVSSSDTLISMPHKDTDGDRTYDFVTSDGADDGPYTKDGNIVLDGAKVTVAAQAVVDDQASNGNTIVVETVDLSQGGFVTIHDASLNAGNTFDSVRGTSNYLKAGLHRNVKVTLSEPMTTSQTVVAMPHRDTNANQQYDFVTSDGSNDGPFTRNGNIIVDTARASINAQTTMLDQKTGGTNVTVRSVTMANGGFVAIHDSTLLDGKTFDSVRGTSNYLKPGTHENVTVTLDEPLEESDTLISMPHRDTNGNQEYDFVSSDGAQDGPYVAGGDIVLDTASVSLAASVRFQAQSSNGESVTVKRVRLPEGGFVTAHDATLLDGKTFESVRGTSKYLDAGVHENVNIMLDEPLKETGTIIAMPHRDTNGNQEYDFVSSDGAQDGPYTLNGDIVLKSAKVTVETATASVTFEDQTSDGSSVTVASVTLPEGGFVTAHDASLQDGATFESVRGTSAYLAAGSHSNVEITLDEPLSESGTIIAMPHRDTNGNQEYDFVSSEGAQDGPYTANGEIVVNAGMVTVEDGGGSGTATQTDGSSGSGPGFGVVAALLALVAGALLARRD